MLKTIVLLLLVSLSMQALNEEADAAIRLAIKEAVLDGLATVDSYVLNTYWYFLRGAEKGGFNVTIQPKKLNYIRIYTNLGNYFRVNCDIDKVTWTPLINNFVQIVAPINSSQLLKPNINILSSNNQVLDVTDQIGVTAEGEVLNSTLQVQPRPLSNPGSSSQGIVVLTDKNPSKDTKIVQSLSRNEGN